MIEVIKGNIPIGQTTTAKRLQPSDKTPQNKMKLRSRRLNDSADMQPFSKKKYIRKMFMGSANKKQRPTESNRSLKA